MVDVAGHHIPGTGGGKKRSEEQIQHGLIANQGKQERMTEESRNENMEMNATGQISEFYQVIQSDYISSLFDPESPLYYPLIAPLGPLFDALNFLTQYDEKGKRGFIISVNEAIAQLKNQTDDVRDYIMLEALRTYLHNRANDNLYGFKMKSITERRKTVTYNEVSGPPRQNDLLQNRR